jgi:hypothetical protein
LIHTLMRTTFYGYGYGYGRPVETLLAKWRES